MKQKIVDVYIVYKYEIFKGQLLKDCKKNFHCKVIGLSGDYFPKERHSGNYSAWRTREEAFTAIQTNIDTERNKLMLALDVLDEQEDKLNEDRSKK